MLLVQCRGEMTVLSEVTAVLILHNAMGIWTDVILLVQCKGEMTVLPEITAIMLHHIAIDIWTDCNNVSTW